MRSAAITRTEIFSNGSIGFFSWRYGKSRLGVDSTFISLLRRNSASADIGDPG